MDVYHHHGNTQILHSFTSSINWHQQQHNTSQVTSWSAVNPDNFGEGFKICFAIIIIILLVLFSKYNNDCRNIRKFSPIKIPLFMIYNYITFDICRNCNVLHCFLFCFSQVGSIAVFFHWKSLNICKRKFISIYRKIKLPYHYFHFIFSIEYWFSNIFLRSLLELQFVLILQPYISRRNRKNNFFTW